MNALFYIEMTTWVTLKNYSL